MKRSQIPDGLLLYEANVEIRYRDLSDNVPCRVYFNLKHDGTLTFRPLRTVENICPDSVVEESFFLSIPGVAEPIECFAARTNVDLDTGTTFVELTPRYSNIEVDGSSPLAHVQAGVLNLGHYVFPKHGGMSFFDLSHQDWLFEFTPVSEVTVLYDPSVQDGDYFFTHRVSMHKSNWDSFTCAEAHDQLNALCTFLSFCHGHWVSTALTSGHDEVGRVTMQEWGTRKVSVWQRGRNWLDEHHGPCMVELYPGFMRLISSTADWNEAIHHVLYWYIRGDASFVGPDGACILLQAALERLAWHVLVRDRHSLSEEGFKRLTAADQLRLLLSTLSIPLTIPTGLTDLDKAAKQNRWADGPQTFVEIRNRLVHPPKATHKGQALPYYAAYQLAKWYLELAILSASGYSGVYSNRTRQRRWIGEVEPVPWA